MRIRTIKPEFFLHEALYDLEKTSSLPIRLSFAGLWCAADREGRFAWEPRKLKAQILPYDEVDFSRVLDALTTRAFIVRYASGTRVLGWIPSFKRHQIINNRERDSELPEPPQDSLLQALDACPTRAPRVPDGNPELESGREGNKEGNKIAVEPNARAGEANRPSWEEVWSYAQKIGLAEWKARDWLDEMLAVGWKDWHSRPVLNWQPMLTRVCRQWEAAGRPTSPPTGKSQANGTTKPDHRAERAAREYPQTIQLKAL